MSSKTIPGYMMTSEQVANQSLRAFTKGKYLIINGRINKFAKLITSILPTKLALRISKNIIKKGMESKEW